LTHTENERLFHPVETARQGELDFGADLSKKEGFSLKERSDRAQVHLFAVSMCQNHVISDDCCGTPFCAETALIRHRSASNFWLIFTGSWVATRFCDTTYVPYLLRTFYLSVTM